MNPPVVTALSVAPRDGAWPLARAWDRPGFVRVRSENGKIVAVETVASSDHVLCDRAGGRVIAPEFADAHLHGGLLATMLTAADLRGATSTAEVVARVRAVAARTEAGRWVIGRGYDVNAFAADDVPHAALLDAATKDHPVFLASHDEHAAWINSAAMASAHVDAHTGAPAGGSIGRDAAGAPTGVLYESACDLVRRVLPKRTLEQWKDDLNLVQKDLRRRGIRVIQDVDPDTEEGWRALEDEGHLDLYVATAVPARELRRAVAAGRKTGEGSKQVRLGGVKFFLDGALGSRTAAMRAPYADRPATSGMLLYQNARLREELALCRDSGLRPLIHAIGDAALAQALDTLIDIGRFPADCRPRIEHAQTVADDDIARFVRSGAVASMQPCHLATDAAFAAAALGDRTPLLFRCESLRAAGVPVILGSDAPVEPPDPVATLQYAIQRAKPGHRAFNAREAMTFDAALAASTTLAAAELGFPNALTPLAVGSAVRHVELVVDTGTRAQ